MTSMEGNFFDVELCLSATNWVVLAVQQCRQHLELLLESIPTMFQNNRTSDSAFGAAVKVFDYFDY